ncbi:MAG: hypothetical protein IT577_24155 [Verrucomicrobiae bacterium]|nr:hypothetical protein [Verrucomicrobiae bacterium]
MKSTQDWLTITAREARRRGYRPLTRGCRPSETWMLENFIDDMMRGGIDFALVREDGAPDAVAVYRRPGKAGDGNRRGA